MWDVQLELKDMLSLFRVSPDLHTSATTSNILSLLLAPINSYQSALTLLAIPNYSPLLTQQNFATRRTIATAIVSSILKNETALESPEDVSGILDLCHVLVRDQADVGVGVSSIGGRAFKQENADLQEEQGWIARMIHLLRADSLDVQFEVRFHCLAAPLRDCSTCLLTPIRNSCYRQLGGISQRAANASATPTHL